MEKLCFLDDIKIIVFCELFYRLQTDGSAQVGLLCLGIRVYYKNTKCILTMKFAFMTAVNRDKSLLHLMVVLI